MNRSAQISPCGRYRYILKREWDARLRPLVVCMLNPSTADGERDDPTVTALIHFATLWGYGGLHIINLYALRSSSPKAMMASDSPIGPVNGAAIEHAFTVAKAISDGRLLVAWGNDGDFGDRAEWFISRARWHALTLICLGTTRSYKPKHPMARGKHRIARDQQPIVYRS